MMKRFLCLLLCVSICSSLARPVKAVTNDYLNISLADIIIAWYNASGTAIGDTELANAIYSAYGSITIDDLVENGCFFAPDLVVGWDPDSDEMKDYIRELIGYGNLSVPMIDVRVGRLREYLSGIPLSDKASEALQAMFTWEGNLYNENMFALLGMAIGSVVNIGKIGYQLAVETLTMVSDDVKNSYLGKTLLDVYRHFTNTTYFQDLLSDGIVVPGTPGGGGSLPLSFDAGDYAGIGGMADFISGGSSTMYCLRLPEHVYGVVYRLNGNTYFAVFNNTWSTQYYEISHGSASDGSSDGDWRRWPIDGDTLDSIRGYGANSVGLAVGGYAIKNEAGDFPDGDIYAYCRANDPWGGGSSSTVTGVTKYINNAVGNILSDNYLNLSPNIGSDEYMYIFDRPTYIETLNQITNNTDNGDYSDNSTVINNFNETNIQEPDYVTVRPSTAPADPDQPAQPFISPRPTQAPDSFEGVIYEGGISEEITKKFPFCIPWDIKAMIDRLWTPESRAPYLHWDANFGSWGRLGEIDIDLQDFNGVAAIFRATTLLLWIVWLVTITRDLLG